MARELRWRGSSLRDYSAFPEGARRQMNFKLQYLRNGETVSGIKQWHGIGPDGKELSSSGFRAVLTLEFEDAVIVLHAFKKDAARGRRTRHRHSELVRQRYREVCAEYAADARRQ